MAHPLHFINIINKIFKFDILVHFGMTSLTAESLCPILTHSIKKQNKRHPCFYARKVEYISKLLYDCLVAVTETRKCHLPLCLCFTMVLTLFPLSLATVCNHTYTEK